jgi:hypothetical protein
MRGLRNDLDNGRYQCNDEQIWHIFKGNFELTFTNSAAVERADTELSNIKLKDDNVDAYIGIFQKPPMPCRVFSS